MDSFTGLSPDIELCCSTDVILSQTALPIVVKSHEIGNPLPLSTCVMT